MLARRLLLLIASVLLLTSCDHSENYRWSTLNAKWPNAAAKPDNSKFGWRKPSVNVYSYATPSLPAATLSVKDLSDRGQASYIDALAKAKGDSKQLGTTLSKPIGDDSDAVTAPVIAEDFNRTLVATVSEGLEAAPADRLVWTWIDIRPINFSFTGYTIAATDNETLNIESIQNQTTASLQGQFGTTTSNTNAASNSTAPATGTAGTTVGDVLTKVFGTSSGVTGNLSNQYTTSATINQQYEKLHVDIIPEELRIYRGSERNLDVTGNTIISLTAHVDPRNWNQPNSTKSAQERIVQRVSKLTLLTKKGSWLPPGSVDISSSVEKSPPHCDLVADVTMIYLLRKVEPEDARSYIEGEQKASYVQQKVDIGLKTIVPADDVQKPSWRIVVPFSANKIDYPVSLSDSSERHPVVFSSYEQARSFAIWLNAKAKPKAKRTAIGKSGYYLTVDESHSMPASGYKAELMPEPDDLASQCRDMRFAPVANPVAAN